MAEIIKTFLPLLGVLVVVAVLARRLRIAPSILLVIAGIILALIPGLPNVELAPEVVLLVVLPPLIYSAGVAMSWREFKFNLRPITLLAFGCVVFTTCAIAAGTHYVLGLDWATGFVLGAIIAPPDVVAPLAIARRLGLPHRLVVVLEGEGLANDATALILYRFAVIAVTTGAFSLPEAAGTFALIVIGEIIFGIGVGWLSLRLRRLAHDPRVEITLSLMTPYLAYWVPEHLGGSGVLATVACGLYVSWRGPLLIRSATRLQGIFFWDLIVYLIEGMVFLVTGLQARGIIENAHFFPLRDIVVAVLLTTAIAIVARFVWVFPATYLPRWLIPALRRRDPSPPWQQVFVLATTGVRGIVSLAAALAIPFTTAAGAPFPNRDLILFVTFGVIILTLVGLGSLLPAIVRALGLGNAAAEEQRRERAAELAARRRLAELTSSRVDEFARDIGLADEALRTIKSRYDSRLSLLPQSLEDGELAAQRTQLRFALLEEERKLLHDLLRKGEITDEARRRIERDLDLEEQGFRTTAGGADDGERPL
jgi:CPA1 family monovalent cation:H+ antiporter